ncbi:MAG: hypothetical protein JRC86_08995 [Deltaproteobacteria bacterium]|nr:hypothetical protein [Deltaproteobacteria bacterium]
MSVTEPTFPGYIPPATTKRGKISTSDALDIVTDVYQWFAKNLKAKKSANAKLAAELQAKVQAGHRQWQDNLRAQIRTAQNKNIMSTQAIPNASLQVGLTQDQGSIFGGEIKQSHLIIGAIALLLLVKK